MALLTEEPRTANVIACTPVVANVLPAESFHELVSQNPSISVVLTKLISQRLGRSGRFDVLSGRTLGGYQILGRLGRGGMAVVYEAHDPVNNRKVALKMMSHRLIYDQAALDQFQWEADIIESFEHLNITRMYGRFKAFHTYFTVLQYCDGITLKDLIQSNGALPEPLTRAILGQLASALKYAHSKGIVHRDIKPANVMVNRDGTVMLMDFGLAKPTREDQPSLMNLIVGTPRYMAPEQMVGGQVGQVSDYFALGCVLYDMLLGEPLIPETDWLSLLRHHADWELPDFERLCPGLDPIFADVLRGCLQSDPEQRHMPLDLLATWTNPIDIRQLRGFESYYLGGP
jgi:serine/threonine-protein kinase